MEAREESSANVRRVAIAAIVALAACEPTISTTVPRGSLPMSIAGDGWVAVSEPGWFRAEFPVAPSSSVLVWDRTSRGRYQFKKLTAQSPAVLITVQYVEYSDPKDLDEARTVIHSRLEHPPYAGVHAISVTPATLGPASGDQLDATVDPRSQTNDSSVQLDERVMFVLARQRAFQIQCATPSGQRATCERFFAAFRIASSALSE